MVICLERHANDLHMIQLMPLPSRASLKSRTVQPFWCRLTRAVPEKEAVKWASGVCQLIPGPFGVCSYSESEKTVSCKWSQSSAESVELIECKSYKGKDPSLCFVVCCCLRHCCLGIVKSMQIVISALQHLSGNRPTEVHSIRSVEIKIVTRQKFFFRKLFSTVNF